MHSYFLAFLLLVLASFSCRAEVLVIGVEDTRYLPHYGVVDGEYQGLGRVVLDAFFASRGQAVRYRPLPVNRLYRNFLAGELDFKYPANPLWKAELKSDTPIVYSVPVVEFMDAVSVLPEHRNLKPSQLRTVGTVRGFTFTSLLKSEDVELLQVIENDSVRGMIEQALIGRVGGVFANIDVVQFVLRDELKQPDALQFAPFLPHYRDSYRLATIKHNGIIEKFDQWLVQQADFLQQLKQDYHLEQP